MIPLPSWSKVAFVGAAAAILVAMFSTQAVRISLLKRDLTSLEATERSASQAADAWQRTTVAERGERAKERTHADNTRKVLDEERELSAVARADADALRGDVGQLRAAARQYAARRCPAAASPPAAGRSEPAADPGDLQADVLGGMAEDGAALAAEADRRGIAGVTCWRERAALNTDPSVAE